MVEIGRPGSGEKTGFRDVWWTREQTLQWVAHGRRVDGPPRSAKIAMGWRDTGGAPADILAIIAAYSTGAVAADDHEHTPTAEDFAQAAIAIDRAADEIDGLCVGDRYSKQIAVKTWPMTTIGRPKRITLDAAKVGVIAKLISENAPGFQVEGVRVDSLDVLFDTVFARRSGKSMVGRRDVPRIFRAALLMAEQDIGISPLSPSDRVSWIAPPFKVRQVYAKAAAGDAAADDYDLDAEDEQHIARVSKNLAAWRKVQRTSA